MPHSLEQNLAVMWSNSVWRFGDKPCHRFVRDGEWATHTYKDVDDRVRHFALGLISLGLAPLDRVALVCENRPEWGVADLATLAAGGVLVTVFPSSTNKQIGYIVDDSESRILIVSNYFQLRKCLESREVQRHAKTIVIIDPIADLIQGDSRVVTFDDVVNRGKGYDDPAELDRRVRDIRAEQTATIIYTSGTTGNPKGVMLTHGNLLSNVRVSQSLFHLRPTDVALSLLPLSHSLERTAGHFAMLLSGGTVAYSEGMDHFDAELRQVRPTVLVGVPRIYEKMKNRIGKTFEDQPWAIRQAFRHAQRIGRESTRFRLRGRRLPAYLDLQAQLAERLIFRRVKAGFGGRLRFVISGGAPLAVEIAEFFFALGMPLYEGYGLTEASPVVCANCPGAVKLGTVGRPIPGVEVRIEENGEILVRGPNVMKGYYKLPMETAQVVRGGWLYTGDIGELDAEGYLRITGRLKDIIITSGGKNVAPQCIETLLEMEPNIKQVCVVGDRRPFLTAVIVPDFAELRSWAKTQGLAFSRDRDLVRHAGVETLIQAAVDRVNAQLSPSEAVRKFIVADFEFALDNGMLTPTFKVRRKAVEVRFAHEIDQLY